MLSSQPFVIGALAGLASSAHCAAMCGPLASAACSSGDRRSALARYQIGRSAGYVAAGALAGGLGHVVALSTLAPWSQLLVPLLTSATLLWLAARFWRARQTGLVPLRVRGTARTPKRSAFAWLSRLAPRDAISLGVLSALLPCGALGAALLLAATSGDRLTGASTMLGFVTATALPVLGGGFAFVRLARVASTRASRAIALACAALLIAARPVSAVLGARSAAHAPSCH